MEAEAVVDLQTRDRKHQDNSKLLLLPKIEPGNHWYWESKDQYIGRDGEGTVDIRHRSQIKTLSYDILIPEINHRLALNDGKYCSYGRCDKDVDY